ncbi:MAG: hypothetical protein ABI123_07580 [Ginsengibacter sp.]
MRFAFLIPLIFCLSTYGQQDLSNRNYFKKFFRSDSAKNLLIIGENHASEAGSVIYPSLVKYLNKKSGLHALLIEFGPSEAYWYTKYLETGNEKHLNYTLYAGGIKGWREAWREIYAYNKTLKKPLRIIGIDFDRTRTLAYALFSIFKSYDTVPAYIQPLLEEIKTDKFYKSYTIGYPNKKDIEWMSKTKQLLRQHLPELTIFLKKKDLTFVNEILSNQAVNYADGREEALAANTKRIIENSMEKNFLLLIGRNHTYINPLIANKKTMANILVDSSSINIRTGAILFENSILSTTKDKTITLFEISGKSPWKRHYAILNKKAKKNLTVVPLTGDLCSLSHYIDFTIIGRNLKQNENLNN